MMECKNPISIGLILTDSNISTIIKTVLLYFPGWTSGFQHYLEKHNHFFWVLFLCLCLVHVVCTYTVWLPLGIPEKTLP